MRPQVLLLLLLALSCSTKNPYLGSWDSEITLMGNRVPLVSTFGEKGDYFATFDLAGVNGTLTGTYSHEQERLRIVLTKLDLRTKGSFLPKSMIDQGREAIEKELQQSQEGKVTWSSESAFAVQPDRDGVPLLTFKKRPA